MAPPRTHALLFGHDRRLAVSFLVVAGLVGVGASTSLSRTVVDEIGGGTALVVALALVAGYAYWNDGFAACWLSIFVVLFGGILYDTAHPRIDLVYAEPVEQALMGALLIAGLTGPIAFVAGVGVRTLSARLGIPDRFRSSRTLALAAILRGAGPASSVRMLLGGVVGGVVLAAGVATTGPRFTGHPPDWLLHPLLVAVVLVVTAALDWQYADLLLALATLYFALLGLFVGFLVGPEGFTEAIRGGLWYALVVTLVVGVPGTFVGELPRPWWGTDAQVATTRT